MAEMTSGRDCDLASPFRAQEAWGSRGRWRM